MLKAERLNMLNEKQKKYKKNDTKYDNKNETKRNENVTKQCVNLFSRKQKVYLEAL